MYVFQNFSEGDTPEPPFGAGTQVRASSPSKSRLRAWLRESGGVIEKKWISTFHLVASGVVCYLLSITVGFMLDFIWRPWNLSDGFMTSNETISFPVIRQMAPFLLPGEYHGKQEYMFQVAVTRRYG